MPTRIASRNEVISDLTQIFRNVFDDPSIVLSETMTANDIAEWDSLNHINLIVAAEKHFGIKFLTSEVGGMDNVGEFIDTIWKKAGAA